ncbi:hypothetical protein F5Y03DRAFT_123051 [Xylaria venustula]|nr:hypothetical protein F5Y03DRAFT_123051 [Xylaria venustula]
MSRLYCDESKFRFVVAYVNLIRESQRCQISILQYGVTIPTSAIWFRFSFGLGIYGTRFKVMPVVTQSMHGLLPGCHVGVCPSSGVSRYKLITYLCVYLLYRVLHGAVSASVAQPHPQPHLVCGIPTYLVQLYRFDGDIRIVYYCAYMLCSYAVRVFWFSVGLLLVVVLIIVFFFACLTL